MSIIILILLFLLALMAGAIWLQIFLSKKESKWFGLILPFVCFSYTLIMLFSIVMFDSSTGLNIFVSRGLTLFVTSTPTIVLLVIYFECREKVKRKKALDKMNIQDLQ